MTVWVIGFGGDAPFGVFSTQEKTVEAFRKQVLAERGKEYYKENITSDINSLVKLGFDFCEDYLYSYELDKCEP